MMDSWKSMFVTFDDLMQHVKRVAERSGYSVSEGHPEDLVSSLVPLMEAWSDGFGVGYQQGVVAGREIQKSIDKNAVSYEQIRDRMTESCDKHEESSKPKGAAGHGDGCPKNECHIELNLYCGGDGDVRCKGCEYGEHRCVCDE